MHEMDHEPCSPNGKFFYFTAPRSYFSKLRCPTLSGLCHSFKDRN